MNGARQPLRPAVFLDRDGTIIEDRGDLADPEQVEFLTGAIAGLQRLGTRFALFIITNQPAVAAGRLSEEQVAAVNAVVVAQLRAQGVVIERVFVCPHSRSEGCACIKPRRHFLDVAAREHGIDLARSFTVGDHPHDAELARTAGATGLYVLTGHGARHRAELGPGHVVVPSLLAAADIILDLAGSPEACCPAPGCRKPSPVCGPGSGVAPVREWSLGLRVRSR